MGNDRDTDGTVRATPQARRLDANDPDAKQRAAEISTDKTIDGGGAAPAAAAEPATAERDLPAGHQVGEYVIEGVLGRGGFGTVYRAVQPLIGKRVAIKVLSRKFSADREMVSRFVAEAKAVNQIRHRHIIDIFSFSQLPDGRQYYVMEHLEGEPLDKHLAAHGKLSLEAALPILRAVARALDAAHAKGVAHRDLKPENVFLARDDEGGVFPKLLDFGIAKLSNTEEQLAHKTNTGVPIGTPYYMSPEQCRGSGVDHRTDLYSLGVMTYRLLTGKFPFDGALIDILHKQMYDEPRPPSLVDPALDETIDAAILAMMHKDPAARPANAMAAVRALQGDAATPTASSLPDLSRATSRRGPLLAALATVVVLAAGLGVYFAVFRASSDPAPPQTASTSPHGGAGLDAAPAPGSASGSGSGSTPAPGAGSARAAGAGATAGSAAEPPPATPERVIVTVSGAPEGTEVLIGGDPVGTAPGPVQLPYGERPVVLTFRADGYLGVSRSVTPSRDQRLKVALKRKRTRTRTRPRVRPDPGRDPDADDVIHVFGKENQ